MPCLSESDWNVGIDGAAKNVMKGSVTGLVGSENKGVTTNTPPTEPVRRRFRREGASFVTSFKVVASWVSDPRPDPLSSSVLACAASGSSYENVRIYHASWRH